MQSVVQIARRASLLAVAVVLSQAGIGGAVPASTAPATLSPSRLPALPAQGLVVQTSHGVVLETTTGRAIGELPSFALGPPQDPPLDKERKIIGLEELAAVDPRVTVLYDRRGNGWLLDVAGRRLDPVTKL